MTEAIRGNDVEKRPRRHNGIGRFPHPPHDVTPAPLTSFPRRRESPPPMNWTKPPQIGR